jgi:LytS/YehU family sensor histidine kinase
VLTKSSRAKEIILKLSDIMKYTLYESNEETVSIKADIDNVLNYIELEKVRQGNNALIETKINYGSGDQLICPLLFLPLVENAFKHGVNDSLQDAFLYFSFEADANTVMAEISNSKTNAEVKNKKEHPGIGLYNLKRRLSIFYPGKHSIEISDEPKTYTVKLIIDIS